MEKTQIPSFKVQIGDYTKEDGVVSYNMRILSVGDNSFHIVDRYRNMRSLWDEIRQEAANPAKIPDFPPKKWFGSRNREFIEARKSALEIFFNTLLDSPDKNVYRHIMKYFRKLARTREARDAITSIEEIVAGGGQKKNEESKNVNNSQSPNKVEAAKSNNAAIPNPVVQKNRGMNSKDYTESWNKIVENFNKKLIDLGYTAGADAIQDIMNKGQAYKKHFADSGINKEFAFNTRLLSLPKGNDSNFQFLEQPDEEIEAQIEEFNEPLEKLLQETQKTLYEDQYDEFIKINDIIWMNN